MPRPRKPATAAPPARPAAKSSQLVPTRKPDQRAGVLTRERLDEHMEAFRKAGGKIEVLGVTRALQRIDMPSEPATTVAPRGKFNT